MTSSIEKSLLKVNNKTYQYFSLPNIAKEFNINLNNIPFSLRILLENLVRTYSDKKY
jgi:aconitase A